MVFKIDFINHHIAKVAENSRLAYQRDDGLARLGIVGKFATISAMLLQGPRTHDRSTDQGKYPHYKSMFQGNNKWPSTGPKTCHGGKGRPGQNFKRVIWTRHQVESKPARNATSVRSSWTQISQNNMRIKIAQLGSLTR